MGSSPTGGGEKIFFSTAGPKRAKSTTPCGIQTHNLQIRSLTRCSVAPTGQPLGQTSVPALGFHFFFCLAPTARRCAAHNAPDKNKIKNDGAYAPGGTRTPDPGLIRPMLYQTELPELCCPRSGSNQGPSDLQSDALPTELHGRTLAETLRCAPFFFFFSVAATKTKVRRLRLPGIEPGSNAWEASMITITLQALSTPGGDRTRDPRLIRPVLCL